MSKRLDFRCEYEDDGSAVIFFITVAGTSIYWI